MFVLKVIGLVLLGLLALLFLLLLPAVRVHVSAGTGREMTVRVHYLFLRFRLLPPKTGAAGEEPAEEAPKQEKSAKKKAKVPLRARLEQLGELLKTAKKSLALLCRHLVIYKVKVQAAVWREDAHQTALAYAHTCNFMAVFLAVLRRLFVVKKPDVCIAPRFAGEQSAYSVSLRVRIRPIFVVAAGVSLLVRFLGTRGKIKSKSKTKGGQYESAASNR